MVLQMAYILAVNPSIIALTGGTCSSDDCTVSMCIQSKCRNSNAHHLISLGVEGCGVDVG